ncbi:baseplate wedge protein [Salmonella phage SE_PL]|nr:baseplate wedge [Salmonella phage Munch]EAZ2023048.1 GPW/gp25 family protein [Salmonella enterica]ECV9083694.1 GPW/gp25 family protein [Salmonella enterica subsp. enterica serovar Infantis]MCP0435715.1 GPW/gp25 family protein [Salmonella enterica subsp. enterica serovar Mbandaka]QCW18955.1 base plate protein [Salmonella phage 7t3]QIG62776.1 baseplate wedge protein [Salmonella phage SE_PL]WNV47371.1 baseplate wedge protein [Klebsiella phage fENko-Kae01]
MAVIFKGFSSPVVGRTKVLYDEELVKQDLLNHFNTRKGERAFDAEYGFIGWDLVFELDEPSVKQALDDDARRIIAQEPRVELEYLEVSNTEYGYIIDISLHYVELETVEDLQIVFDRRTNEKMIAIASNF